VVRRELRELDADLVERQPDTLSEDDEGDATKDGARIAPMTRARPVRGYEASLLVKPKRRRGDAASARDLTDGQKLGQGRTTSFDLTSS
jgi:hypothetical protein